MEQVTGRKAVAARNGVIRIVQGKGGDDGFRISVKKGKILIEGHNARGAAYGLLELSRIAGVSPWVWWGDVRPERHERLSLPDTFLLEHTPSVQLRGIFINDEDWSLRRWSPDNMGPETYKRLFELMMRLRANTLWPAMHNVSPGFFTVRGNKEMADSFGILIGTSHCEPLLRNNVAEWSVRERGPYNYITNREQVQRYWTERLKEVKGSEELFTIGMRGIHDGSMEGVTTPEEKLQGLQQVIDDQRELIRKHYSRDVAQVPQVFIPYKEVLEIYESGLRVPDDVTLMWCDDNYGYLTRLPDAVQQQRSGGGGIYYHLSYWGRPHDYLWLTTTQPGLIFSEMRAAWDHNCRRLWIANVHDPKVAAYDLELFLDMAWDIDAVTPKTVGAHLERWLSSLFGEDIGRAIAPAMRELCRLNAIRRPEFMGWTQVELDRKKYPGGKSVPGATELTREEAIARMNDFARIEAIVDSCGKTVPERLQDAYFAHVLYPVHAAAAMTRKMLSDSGEGYGEIQTLTERYNTMNGGKWKGLMSAAPRNLPVFAPEAHTAYAVGGKDSGFKIQGDNGQWSMFN
ncbi:MAG: glycosyl hydrolase 115 family protein, partial [Bacteroidaceae bacterium]|nr:glycosyl hydrolase 115 family protein [Bacteroidaceae bacterium]